MSEYPLPHREKIFEAKFRFVSWKIADENLMDGDTHGPQPEKNSFLAAR